MTQPPNFTTYSLSPEIQEALAVIGYKEPTEIQKSIIPLILEDRDVVGKSQTGTGKTAAFGIPVCEKIEWDERRPQALVLEPTRELAIQVRDELFLIGRKKRLKVPAVFGGMPIEKQILTLKQRNHILVGTPGRILDHVRRETIFLSNVKYLIIDEADLMLDMGFLEDVELIIKEIPEKPVISLFSATMGESITKLIDEYMVEPVRVELEGETETVESIEQKVYDISEVDKFGALMDILTVECPDTAMIFCGTREMVNALCHQLGRKRVSCGMLHGALDQRERLANIDSFKNHRFRYLITTDVAARGIDFEALSMVINYDFPTNKENYVHRIGRTGRNGKDGKAISLIDSSERHYVREVESYIGMTIDEESLPERALVEARRGEFAEKMKKQMARKKYKGAGFSESITRLIISGGKRSKIRTGDIVATLCSIDGINQEDIGIIEIKDSLTIVEILNKKGKIVLEEFPKRTLKGKSRQIKRG